LFAFYSLCGEHSGLRTSSSVVSRWMANTGPADESSCGRSFNREHQSCEPPVLWSDVR